MFIIQKLVKLWKKIPNHDNYITTLEFNKLTAENFTARLKQADLVSKTDFDKELVNFNRKIISNKTKYLEVQKKLNRLKLIFFLSQNTFVYQSTRDTLELKKKDKGTDYVLNWKSNGEISFSSGTKQILGKNCKCLYCLWFSCLAKKSY